MRKRIKLLLAAAALLALVIAPAGASAQSYEAFTITSYDFNAEVSENNVYTVTEIISVDFTEMRHGIYREIPVNNKFIRYAEDGTRKEVRVPSRVWGVYVEGWDYEVSTGGGYTTIKIGDADRYVSGLQTYALSYYIGFGNDGDNRFDEVYFNINGPEWPTTIDNFTFSVTLPKEFDADKVGFSMGSEGAEGYQPGDIDYSVDGNTISGKINRTLRPYEGVTLRTELPQGYFDVPDLRQPDWIAMAVMGAIALISLLVFLALGRDKKHVQTVEFYAPDGLTPSEVGYVIDGVVDDRDVVSLIVYWADKGCLSITEIDKKTFKLQKLRELDQNARHYERVMFDGLFGSGSTVTTDELKNTFYTTFRSVKSMVTGWFESPKRRVFTKKSMSAMPWLTFLTTLPFIIALTVTFTRFDIELLFAVVFAVMVGIGLLIPSYILIGLMRSWRGVKNRGVKLFFGLLFWAVFAAVFVLIVASMAYEPLLPWAGVAASVITGLCAVFVRKRTDKGVEWLGKILGLKNFITLAERDRILQLVEENPNYFYNVLPYAYVLGVTDKWVKDFEQIAIEPPNWYYGHGSFTPMLFVLAMHNSMNSFRTNMVSQPPRSGGSGGFGGGGGFSGGGFSGGGGGGGGGGSW